MSAPRLLDVVLGYDCNLSCDYCTITPAMRSRSMSAREVAAAMERARRDGIEELSLTGGEPTIRRDLLPLIRAGAKLGFRSIKVQSNGLLFTPSNVHRLRDAGVTRFHISVHTHRREHYERMVKREGAYDAMVAGLHALVHAGVQTNADLIMKSDTMHALADAVRWLAEQGVLHARLWLVSLTDGNADAHESLPELDELMPHVERAFAAADDAGLRLKSLHLPHCLVGGERAEDPAAGGVRLVTPDDERDLADAKLTPGHYVEACEGCEVKGVCRGLRPDYIAEHGDGAVARARGMESRISGRRRLAVLEQQRPS